MARPRKSEQEIDTRPAMERFLEALAADFEEHGVELIEKARKESPAAYLQIALTVLPRTPEAATRGNDRDFMMMAASQWLR